MDLIVCSTLKRARQTAAVVNRVLKCPVIYREELIERGFGEWEGKKIAPIREEVYYSSGNLYNYSCTESYKGIETPADLCKRVWGLVEELKEYYPGRNLLLVTHGGTMRSINAFFEGLGEDGMLPPIGAKNCQLMQYQA